MTSEVTYEIQPLAQVDPELLRDLNTGGKEWVVVRTSPISVKAWSFHTTEKVANAAARRWRSRDIVTR